MTEADNINVKAVESALNNMIEKMQVYDILLQQQNKSIATLTGKLDLLEKDLILTKLKITGSGPTNLG